MAANTVVPARMQTQEFETNQLQNNLITAITALSNQVVNSPANGQFITGTVLKAGANVITHKLGVLPIGYLIVSQNAVVNTYQVAADKTTITLNASAPATVSLFVF